MAHSDPFDEGELPEYELGPGQTLKSELNYVDLFGDAYPENAIMLVDAIKEVMGGSPGLDAATVQAAVEYATATERPSMLRNLTKSMIRDQGKDIELDDLVTQEVSRVLSAMRDPSRFPTAMPTFETVEERDVYLASTATNYWHLVEPFCWSLQVAARWGTPDKITPWVKGLRSFTAEAAKFASGDGVLIDLRYIPSLVSSFVAALACTGQPQWANFKTLLVDNVFQGQRYDNQSVAIIEAVDPWKPFMSTDTLHQILAHAAKKKVGDFELAVRAYHKNETLRYHTPIAEWLYVTLRPVFDEQFPDDDTYEDEFDAAEAMLGIVAEDIIRQRTASDADRPTYLRPKNKWFGRSTWRAQNHHPNPVANFADAQTTNGEAWGPLSVGLFGGTLDRAMGATAQYAETFRQLGARF
jgi:hypothetical protein